MTKILIDKETVKLAIEAIDRGVRDGYWNRDTVNASGLLKQAIAEAEQAQPPLTDRENSILKFALHRFMSNAYSHLAAAAQDKDGRRYPPDAAEQFAKDARDAEALLNRLQFATPPQRKPLTDEEIEDLYFDKFSMGELKAFARAIEAAHGIKENT